MTRTLSVLVLAFLIPPISQLSGQSLDSASVHALPEIVVTATRSALPLTDSPSPVEILRVNNSESMTGSSVGDLLVRANGILLQDNGGEGALKTVSMRGTASQHLVVLLNGSRISSYQNGLADLSLIPLSDVDRIEVARGGSSALYGADAVGGVINILTRMPKAGLHAKAGVAGGSFGYRQWNAEIGGGGTSFSGFGGAMVEESQGDFNFVAPRTGTSDTAMERVNSDFRRVQLYTHGTAALRQGSTVSFAGQWTRSRNGVPGPLSVPSPEARQNDDQANLQVRYQEFSIGDLKIDMAASYHYGLENFRDPNPIFPYATFYRTSSLVVNPQVQIFPASGTGITAGGEFANARLNGGDFDGKIIRNQQSAYVMGEYRLERDSDWWDRVSLFGTVRYDNFSDIESAVTPKIGANLRIAKSGDIRIRGSYGKNFRVPTFNDLYFVGFNNPDLKPEHSTNVEVGLTSVWTGWGRHTFEVTGYFLQLSNRIIFDLVSFRPENIGKSSSEGIEFHYEGFVRGVRWSLNYSTVDARKLNRDAQSDPTYRKRIPFIPSHMFNSSVSVELGSVTLSLFHVVTGRRYVDALNSQALPIHRYTDVALDVPAGVGDMTLHFHAEVGNIFDNQFSIVPDYPMPGRHYKAAIRLAY